MTRDPHVPVLMEEVVAAMALHQGDTVVDGTFGAGGYTRAFLAAGAGRVIAFDRDPDAIAAGSARVADERLTLVNDRFSQMDRVLAERGIGLVDCDRARYRGQLDADRPGGARLLVPGRRPARHADGQIGADRRRIPEDGRRGRDRPGTARVRGGTARPGDRSSYRCRAPGRADRRAGRDRAPGRRLPAGPEERPRDADLPGDPDPPQRRARRARAGARGGGARVEARRPSRGRHLPQPRGPDREAFPARA